MGFYRTVILPKLCDLSMRNERLKPYRERVVGAAEGRVLEIGAGSGLNLKLYRQAVSEIVALEPDPKLVQMAKRNASGANRPVTFLETSAEAIPLEGKSVDTVVTTWTLCTVPLNVLPEIRRVLKPGGKLLFVEHGLAPEKGVQRWQNRLDPIWSRISGGCHINRPIRSVIEDAGFRIEKLETGYFPGPKVMGFFSEGSAKPS